MTARLVIVLLLLALVPATALGHSGAGAASDYRSEPDALRDAAGQVIPGAEVTVIGGDDRVRLRWTGDGELVVRGYAGEPYLRLGPEGAFENAIAPSVAANRDRYGTVDPAADADAAPVWRRISDEPVAVWHDHRSHWMSASSDPAGVVAAPGREQEIERWTIAMSVDGRPAELTGRLVYVPPPSVWAWVAAVLGAAVATAVVVLRAARGTARAVARISAAAAVIAGAGLAAAEAAAAPGDGLTDGLSGALPPGVQAAIWIAGAAAGGVLWWRAARRGAGHEAVVMLAAAWIIGGGAALGRLDYLAHAILPAPLPDPLARLAVAVALVALAAPTAWAWRALAEVRSGAGGRPGRGYTRPAPTANAGA